MVVVSRRVISCLPEQAPSKTTALSVIIVAPTFITVLLGLRYLAGSVVVVVVVVVFFSTIGAAVSGFCMTTLETTS